MQLAHHFEVAKAAANEALQDRQLQPPRGQRVAARQSVQEEWARRRQAEESEQQRQLSPSTRALRARHLKTSPDNFLADEDENGPGYEDAGATLGRRPTTSQMQRVQSLRTYSPAALPPDSRTHLGNNCFPLGDDEEEARGGPARAGQSRATLEEFAAARALGRDMCYQYPHGLPKRTLATMHSERGRIVQLADLPSLDLARVP